MSHPDYRPVTTQLFPSDDPYLKTDSVFAVKDDLVVEFKPLKGDKQAEEDLEYNIILPPRPKKEEPKPPTVMTGSATNGESRL